MRSHLVVLVPALGCALWMMSEFLTVGSSNMPTIRARFVFGLIAFGPLLLVAGVATIALVRKRTARIHPIETGVLVASLIVGVVWALGFAWSSG